MNEEVWADIVNEYVGAIPHKIAVESSEFINDMANLIKAQGEPFSDLSIYAQNRVFKEAKAADITVILDGQGADEMLGGYVGYPNQVIKELFNKRRVHRIYKFVNGISDRIGVPWVQLIKPFLVQLIKSFLVFLLPGVIKEKIKKNMNKVNWLQLRGKTYRATLATLTYLRIEKSWDEVGRDLTDQLRYELTGGRISRLLRYEDRNSMFYSLESRVPFLTLELAEFLLSMPSEYLVSEEGITKKLFREAMRGIVPDKILDRKDKIGFEAPDRILLQKAWPTLREVIKWDLLKNIAHIDKVKKFIDESLISDSTYDDKAWRIILFCQWMELSKVNKSIELGI